MKIQLVVAAATLLLLGACEISKPHLPQWDVDVSIPLFNDRFMVSELADSVHIVIGDDEVLTVIGTGSAEPLPFGDVNYLPDVDLPGIPLYSGTQHDVTLPLQDPTGRVFLSFGEFDFGQIDYLFDLTETSNAQISLAFPDILTPAGTPLTITHSGPSGSWQSTGLAGCLVGIEDSGVLQDSLRAVLTVNSDQPDDTLIGEAHLRVDDEFAFNRFQGYLYDYVWSLEGEESTIDISYPYGLEDAIQLLQASVRVDVVNETGFAAEFHGELRAKNNRTGQEQLIPILDDQGNFFVVQPASETGPVLTSFQFSNHVTEILQIMPDEVQITQSYLLINGGHDGTPGFVQDTDEMHCTYQFDVPMQLNLYDHQFVMDEAVEVEISEDNQDFIQDNLLGAELTAAITNRIPVGVNASLYVSTQPDILISDPNSYSFSKTVKVHSRDYSGPEVDEEGVQTVHISLTSEEIQTFAQPLVYLLWAFSFEPSEGPITITASPADYIQIIGMLRAGVHIEVD